jgi:hypothetical protein
MLHPGSLMSRMDRPTRTAQSIAPRRAITVRLRFELLLREPGIVGDDGDDHLPSRVVLPENAKALQSPTPRRLVDGREQRLEKQIHGVG